MGIDTDSDSSSRDTHRKRYCVVCAYDLRAATTRRCAECGTGFDPTDPETYSSTPRLLRRLICRFPALRKHWVQHYTHLCCRACGEPLGTMQPGRCPKCHAYCDPQNSDSVARAARGTPRLLLQLNNGAKFLGIVVPLVFAVYGAYCLATGTAVLVGGGRGHTTWIRLTGPEAYGMGFAWLGGALALHSHFFWGQVEPYWRIAPLGVVVGGMVGGGGLGTTLWLLIRHWMH